MDDRQRKATYRSYLKGELEAAAVYEAMANTEENSERADVFRQLAQAEMRHGSRWAEKLGMNPDTLVPARGGIRLRLLRWAAQRFGTHRMVPLLIRGESKEC